MKEFLKAGFIGFTFAIGGLVWAGGFLAAAFTFRDVGSSLYLLITGAGFGAVAYKVR